MDQSYPGFLAQNKKFQNSVAENNNAAVAAAREHYRLGINSIFTGCKPALDEELLAVHKKQKKAAVNHFNRQENKGGDQFSKAFIDKLEKVDIIFMSNELCEIFLKLGSLEFSEHR